MAQCLEWILLISDFIIMEQKFHEAEKGVLVWPGASGATNWWPPSFHPGLNLAFIPALNRPSVYFLDEDEKPRDPPTQWLGGTSTPVRELAELSIVAIDTECIPCG